MTVVQIILTVELVQLFTFLGSGDVDDLLLNVLGASMGYACWKGICRTVKGRKRRI